MPAGRPTKATPENVEFAEKYVKDCLSKKLLPTVEELAFKMGVHKDTLYERDEFSDVLGKLKMLQGYRLIKNGLNSTYNPTIAKLMLMKHGYVEKTQQDNDHHGTVSVIYRPEKKSDDFDGLLDRMMPPRK